MEEKCSICGCEHYLTKFGFGWICKKCIAFIKTYHIENAK